MFICRIVVQQRRSSIFLAGTMTRSQGLPDIPTVAEFVPGYEAISWSGVGAPKKAPAEIRISRF
jgi:tripartite-type tricarboxylate transporter receptor subunit TctC